MRETGSGDGIQVQLVAGTYVVLIGISVDAAHADDLLGFSIERTDHTEGERHYLSNNLVFEGNDEGEKSDYSTERNPVQAFVWGDYTAKPAHTYTYAVTARHGSAAALKDGPSASVTVKTEDPDDGDHAVYFNRGVAASAAYQRRFGDKRPEDVPNEEAFHWLSRGLEEAMIAFIGRAVDESYSLRASVFEFNFPAVLEAFRVAHQAGADVKIVFHDVGKEGPKIAKAIEDAQIKSLSIPRKHVNISHNKFIVLLKDEKPIEVWTGSTNVTKGGIFGHANVGHLIRDPGLAGSYLAYWEELAENPERDVIKAYDDPRPEFPTGRPDAPLTSVFSPRSTLKPLQWYLRLGEGASQGVFLAAAFGLQEIAPLFDGDRDYLRYALLDEGTKEEVTAIRRDPDNEVSAGAVEGGGEKFKTWLADALRGINGQVHYVHAKLMIVDPLTEDPVVITGSQNWSDESCEDNDENAVVIRGDKRVADLYLTEYMRLFNHYRLRGKTDTPEGEIAPGPGSPAAANKAKVHLKEDGSWAKPFYEDATPEAKERMLFSGAEK